MSQADVHNFIQTALQTATHGSGGILQVIPLVLAGLFAAGGIINLIGPQWLLTMLAPLGLGGGSPKTRGILALAAGTALAKPDLQVWCIGLAVVILAMRVLSSILKRLRVFEFVFLALVFAIPPLFVAQFWTSPTSSEIRSNVCAVTKCRAPAVSPASALWLSPRLPRHPAG